MILWHAKRDKLHSVSSQWEIFKGFMPPVQFSCLILSFINSIQIKAESLQLHKGNNVRTNQALMGSFYSEEDNNKKCWQEFPNEKNHSKRHISIVSCSFSTKCTFFLNFTLSKNGKLQWKFNFLPFLRASFVYDSGV